MFAASDGNDQGEKVLSNGDDLLDQSQTVRLLGKDLPAEARSIRPPSPGKTNSVTEDDRPSSHVMKVFSGMNDRTQPPSLLERGLLPGFRSVAFTSKNSLSIYTKLTKLVVHHLKLLMLMHNYLINDPS